MEQQAFNWAVIGSGGIANRVCKEIVASGRHKVVSCYSRNDITRDAFAGKFGAKSCKTLGEAVSLQEVDGIYIASPHGVHFKHIMEALQYNKPILCEKAFTLNAKEAEIVINTAREKGIFIAEAIWMFFNPTIRQILAWIESGAIGKVKSIDANFSIPFFKAFSSKRIWENSAGAGALLDLGIYTIGFGYLFSEKAEVSKVEGQMKIVNDIDVWDKNKVTFGEVICNLRCSMRNLCGKAKIVCEEGEIIVNRFHVPTRARMFKGGKKIAKHKAYGGYMHEFDSIVADIRSGATESHIVTQKDTLTLMRIMDEIRKQNGLVYSTELK